MFSGIHSLIFGKKNKHKHDSTVEDNSQSSNIDNEFVILERRHSDDDKNLYPNLDPSNPALSNLPYVVSPSLPNINDPACDSLVLKKEEGKADMLHGVPFVLSPQILILLEEKDKRLNSIAEALNDLKENGDEIFFQNYSYDFQIEHSVAADYS